MTTNEKPTEGKGQTGEKAEGRTVSHPTEGAIVTVKFTDGAEERYEGDYLLIATRPSSLLKTETGVHLCVTSLNGAKAILVHGLEAMSYLSKDMTGVRGDDLNDLVERRRRAREEAHDV